MSDDDICPTCGCSETLLEHRIRAEYEGNLQRLTEANLAYGAEIDRLRADHQAGTLDVQWARWIVRQGRNPEPGCPQCGPLGMDAAPRTCIPHQALARLAGDER